MMVRRGDSNRIDEQRVCIDSLVQRLKEIDGDQTIAVREESDDPPDFWVRIAGREYAAEVTSIVADQDYDALCERLVKSIQAESEANNMVEGTYALAVMRKPQIPKKGTNPWKRLVSASVKAMQAMVGSSAGAETYLIRTRAGRLSLMKGSCAGGTIGLIRTPESKWGSEVRDEISRLLQKAIDTKRAKIEKKGVASICPDVVLLIYDAYGYGDVEHARQALETVQGYEWFHSIFWATSFSDRQNTLYPDSPGRSGVFLYSKNPAWQ